MAVAPHIVIDLGGVVGLPQPPEALTELADLVGMPLDGFTEAYLAHRDAYDAGCSDRQFWTSVTGSELPDELIAELTHRDLDSYLQVNHATVTALRTARERGARITLLSNAPTSIVPMVDAIAELDGLFDRRVFSGEHRIIKPDPRIYRLAAVGIFPGPTVFIDDKESNLVAPQELGWKTILFDPEADLVAQLEQIGILPATA